MFSNNVIYSQGAKIVTETDLFTGEISENYPLLSNASYNFSATWGGIGFKLKEYPDKAFSFHMKSFDDAVKYGLMTKSEGGVYQFEKLVGWKVKVVCSKKINEDGSYNVISLERLNDRE